MCKNAGTDDEFAFHEAKNGNKGAQAISEKCQDRGVRCCVVGVPKSIDNDILLVREASEVGIDAESAPSCNNTVPPSCQGQPKGLDSRKYPPPILNLPRASHMPFALRICHQLVQYLKAL
eukprot:1160871-Pelagomonas_calceolata.AAC.11